MRIKFLNIFSLFLIIAASLFMLEYRSSIVMAAAVNPTLPLNYVDSTYPTLPVGHSVINVKTSCSGQTLCYTDPQSAVNAAVPGDEVVLQAGAVFTGPLTLPVKSCGFSNQNQCWIVVRTSNMSSLPQAGTRVSPADTVNMSKILAPGSGTPALVAAPGSAYYRLTGIEFTKINPAATTFELLTLGINDSTQTNLSQVPSHIVIDRDYIHGDPTSDLKRGIGLNSSWSAVVDSYISDIHVVGQDAQAIAAADTPGPLKIVNNYLEAAAENMLVGGDDPQVQNLVPSDIEVRNNYFYKPRTWRVGDPTYAGFHWAVKNIFELKNAQRVLIDSNIFDGNWLDGQSGFAILFNVRNQSGTCPWCIVQDVTFQNNIVRHTGSGLSLLGHDNDFPSLLEQRIKVYNNIWDDVSGTNWGGSGIFALFESGTTDPGPSSVQIVHNTVNQSGNFISADAFLNQTFITKPNTVVTDNLAANNAYGVIGDSDGIGNTTLNDYFPGVVFTKNILMGGLASSYSSYLGNYFPAIWTGVVVNQPGGDYHVVSTSIYHNAGTDGKDIGADIDAVNADTATVMAGNSSGVNPSPTPTPAPTPPPSDTLPPVVVSFDVQPINTTGNVTASFNISDTGGSFLKQIELWRAPFAAVSCNDSDKSSCTWSQTSVATAPTNSNSWTSQVTDTVPTGIFYYGIHALDNALNVGHEPSLVKITSSTTPTYQRTISIASLDGRASKVVTGILNVLNSSKTLIKSYVFTTNSSGQSTITFDIPTQSAFLQIKALPFLTREISQDLNLNTTYVFPLLLTGDINQDNIVNSIDFSTLNSHWFTNDSTSDLNQDGLVNSLDFSLLNKNWFVVGEQ